MQFVPLGRLEAIAFQPFIQVVLRNTDPAGHLGGWIASFRDLLDRLGPEFFQVAFAANNFSFCLSLTLRSVYWSRGDSIR